MNFRESCLIMKTNDVICGWLKKIESILKEVDRDAEFDSYCRSLFAVLCTYYQATHILLEQNLRLPACANLRIMSELLVKFLWCLHGTTNFEEVRNRFQRWALTTGTKKKKLYDELIESTPDREKESKARYISIRDCIAQEVNKLESSSIKQMPHMTGNGGLFEGTYDVFGRNVAVDMYGQFCEAVHIDTSVLARCIKRQGNELIFTGDLDHNVDELRLCCLNLIYMYVKIICIFYRSDDKQIEDDYQDVLLQAGKINNKSCFSVNSVPSVAKKES